MQVTTGVYIYIKRINVHEFHSYRLSQSSWYQRYRITIIRTNAPPQLSDVSDVSEYFIIGNKITIKVNEIIYAHIKYGFSILALNKKNRYNDEM